jgi:D-serine deaminase-like pyridoxal phosphate-dependent protein
LLLQRAPLQKEMPLPLPVPPAQLEALASEHGTPLQLYDEAGLRANARAFMATMRAAFPGFRQFYAVKALPNPAVLRVLLEEGCGLDCSSTAELHAAALLGVPGDRVMYTSNYTSKKDLGVAFDQGVIINLDDASLVRALVEARGRAPELICFRLNPGLGRTDSETASNVLGGTPNLASGPPSTLEAVSESVRPRPGLSRKQISSGARPRAATSAGTSDASSRLMMTPWSNATPRSSWLV